MQKTHLVGARTHNLKSVSIDLAEGELIGLAGVSGSGKSSLAVDTLYAEGQRRFVESFSPYARQFLERLERPPMDELDPVAAAVAVDRRAPIKSSRSTVATMADAEAYFSALFTREAVFVCPRCQLEAVRTDPRVAARSAIEGLEGERAIVAYPVRIGGTADLLEAREKLLQDGYRRVYTQEGIKDLDEIRPSEAIAGKGQLEIIVDRLRVASNDSRRLEEAIEQAWQRSGGEATLFTESGARSLRRGLVCPQCAESFEPARPGLFSYQSPVGACPECRGFGRTIGLDLDKVIPDPSLSIADGAIRAWTGPSSAWERKELLAFCKRKRISTRLPWRELNETQRAMIIEGEGRFEEGHFCGIRPWFRWLETRTYKMHVRVFLSRFRSYETCTTCQGKRLNEHALSYRIGGLDLAAWHALEISEALRKLDELRTATAQGELVRKELLSRLAYLERVGLGYLTLDRPARTLSGGEAQRVSLTAALGTSLTGALFVLDEPTVGLHPTDVPPLVEAMRNLADRGNIALVVEHDTEVLRACDRVLEMGPGAGAEGGRLLFDGPPSELAKRKELPTGRALGETLPIQRELREPSGWLVVRNAKANNLRGIDVELPLGVLAAITGPSGSGKSTLAEDIVYRAIARARGDHDVEPPGAHDGIEGISAVGRVILVDQSPLGRTSRGNAATYTKAWDRLRARFAAEPEAVVRGFTPAHFSFNVEGGRCEACSGEGYETVEMQFLADVALICPVCRGRRFKDEILAVRHRGWTVAETLEKTVDEALRHFEGDAPIVRALSPLAALGLGYLPLGQPLSTLSGGEAQRVKLARALTEKQSGSLFILDEPSAGLHPQDVAKLVEALDGLVRSGASVLVVDHDLDLIRAADWLIDLGPGGGKSGGTVVAQGRPEDIVRAGKGATAKALAASRSRTIAPSKAKRTESETRAIVVEHAREHNLRDVSCEIPRGKLVVVTGPSGSGKSTLAFDVVFAEGQRRFLETLTPYARQFLPTMPRPDVDRVTGVPPSIALEQRTSRAGGASTVATVTEVAHYLRLLFAKLGEPHCPSCDAPITALPVDALFAKLRSLRGVFTLLSPAVQARKGTYLDLFTAAARAGIHEAWVDGELVSTDSPPALRKTQEHDIDLVIFRGRLDELDRITLDRALAFGHGAVRVRPGDGASKRDESFFSTRRSCPRCHTAVPELDPRWFSFNTKQGRCEVCEGLGQEDGEICRACEGSRLAPIPRAVRLEGARYHEITREPVSQALARVRGWKFTGDRALVGEAPRQELLRRLEFLVEVGLSYLSLDRPASTLSGGEMQRLRLSAQLGSGLTGALYVLDEPTIGLHPRDTHRLLGNLRKLVDTGSTVLVVEHDADTIRAADHLIDLGPRGGRGGGRIVASGAPAEVLGNAASPTAQALSEPPIVSLPDRGKPTDFIELRGAKANNLRDVTLRIPLGRMTVVAGVSGSGKSTLVRQVFLPALRQALGLVAPDPGPFERIVGAEKVKRALAVDQSPIGRTPRSVPATFLGIWDEIRRLFAATPEAKVKGFTPARFSFNTGAGGRCTTCDGAGVITHEMSFLPDVTTPCSACGGLRFEPSTLEVKYLGLSIGEVLRLTAEEAAEAFHVHPSIARPLVTLSDLGVGYVQLGQGSNTLSGGEAQRLKLAAELTPSTRHEPTVYVLDEPTTGLHLADVKRLIDVLSRLVDRGDTLVVIEHHPMVIGSADHVIELGPEGGVGGGRIVAEGTPREVARLKTATGEVLRETLPGR